MGGRYTLGMALVAAGCSQSLWVGDDRSRGEAARDGGSAGQGDASADDASASESPGELVQFSDCTAPSPVGIDDALLAALRAGGGAPLEPLLPYADTVFPRGLAPPMVRWRGADASAALVVLEGSGLRYESCVRSDDVQRLTLPEGLWRAAEEAALRGDGRFALRVALASDGAVVGSLSLPLRLARTAVRGSVTYQAYAPGGAGASLVRLPIGGAAASFAPVVGCQGCHGLARGGSQLVVEQNALGQSFPVSAAGLAAPSGPITGMPGAEFAALTPDGAWYLAPARPVGAIGPRSYGGAAQAASGLFRARDGSSVVAPNVPLAALTPAFSPDGRSLVFNDLSGTSGHGLALSPFDPDAPAFAPARAIYAHDTLYPAWPALLPDGRVLFTLTGEASLGGGGAGLDVVAREPPRSQLVLLDLARGLPALLHRANGYADAAAADAARSYLPADDEPERWFYPTVLAQDVADFVFACFDGYRRVDSDRRVRALWCSGLAPEGDDPSSPPFFLPGQDLRGGAFRALASEDPP